MQLQDRFYKSPEVADILGVSLRTLYRYMESGKIKSIVLPSGRHRFTKEQIEEFLYSNKDIPLQGIPTSPNSINVGQSGSKIEEENQRNTEEEIISQTQENTLTAELQEQEEPRANSNQNKELDNKDTAFNQNTVATKEETSVETNKVIVDNENEANKTVEETAQTKAQEEDEDTDLEAELERLLASLEEDEEETTKEPESSNESSILDEVGTLDSESLGQKEEFSPALDENKVHYFYCPYNELRRIARIIEKTAKDEGKDYAFTMNAGLSLYFPLNPFSIIHFYIHKDDLDFWKEKLQLKESSDEDANIGILMTEGSAFENIRDVSGLKVVNKERLIENLKANNLEDLVEEAEEKL